MVAATRSVSGMTMEKRIAGYVRVSKEREGMMSPEIQQQAITAYCTSRGWTVKEWFTDVDFSGLLPPEKRPQLQELLQRSQLGDFDLVVVYRIDRLSREPADYYAILGLLSDARVEVDAAAQPRDHTPEGALLWDLSAILARYESLKLGARLKDMHAQLARQGKYAGNQPPFGWRRVRDPDGQQRLVLDPGEAPWRQKMHQWFQQGWSLHKISEELNRQGVPTRRGAGWRASTIRRLLEKPMQVGSRVHGGEEFNTGRIEPLLDRETYERTLALVEARKTGELPGRPSQRSIPAGLLVCGTCGSRLYAQRSSKEGVPYYACASRTRGGLCNKGPYIRESVLVAFVEPLLLKRLGQMTVRARQRATPPDISPLRAEQEGLEISLARLAALYSEGSLPESEYHRAAEMQRRKLQRVRDRLRRAIDQMETAALKDALGPTKFTPELWELLPIDSRQALYRLAIERIVINAQPEEPRIQVFWRS